jgi:hypothetical protein
VHNAAAQFTSHSKLRNYAEPKTIFLSQTGIFGFSSSNSTVQDHIPIATGDALRH